MGWRDWSYTKKGMIISAVLIIIISIWFLNGFEPFKDSEYEEIVIIPAYIIAAPTLFSIFFAGTKDFSGVSLLVIFFGFLINILIWSAVGYIYGKIKSRNK